MKEEKQTKLDAGDRLSSKPRRKVSQGGLDNWLEVAERKGENRSIHRTIIQ